MYLISKELKKYNYSELIQVDQIYKNKPQNINFTEMQVTIYINTLKKKYPKLKNPTQQKSKNR